MCWFWVGFSDLWIIIGLAGYTTTFLIGTLIFKPTADRMGEIIAREGITPAVLELGRRILRVARFDYTVMLIVVADMVLKPTSGDTGILAAMVLLLVVGGGRCLCAFAPDCNGRRVTAISRQMAGRQPALAISRSRNFWILPVDVLGISAKKTALGHLNRASSARQCAMISSLSAAAPGLSST